MATNTTFNPRTRAQSRALGNRHPTQTAVMSGQRPNIRVVRRRRTRASAPGSNGRLGTAPIQKPPTGNFYCAGEYCPQINVGKTTQNSAGRTLIGRYDNGLRWKYA